MKPFLKILSAGILIMCLCNSTTAQTLVKYNDRSGSPEVAFPILNVLIDSAIKHSALVQFRSTEVDVKGFAVTSQKNGWLRNLGLQGETRYGTFDNYSSNSLAGQTATIQAVNTKQLNYSAGVYIKLPVFDVANRKTEIRQAKAELEGAKKMQEAQEEEVRQLVIKQYQDVLLKQKLLSIKSQNFGNATVNMEMVEKQFRNGTIAVAEYVRLSDITARIESDYELAKSEFTTSKKILEEIVGFSFRNPDLKAKE